MQEIVSVRNRARFVPPNTPEPIITRERLGGLYAQATGRILRVLAPSGYGKSTQVAHWVTGDARHVGWVDLERIDNDPFVLASALARALTSQGGELSDAQWDAAFDGRGAAGNIAPQLGGLVEQIERPFVLVLDDVHLVDSIDSSAVIDAVAEHLPSSCTLVLCGRSHPDQRSLARRRLHPGVIDVAVHDLALDATETDELLTSMGVRLELRSLTELCDGFEGWAAGIRLAGLALRREGEPSWLSPDQVGDATYVVDYLRSEWTGQLTPEDKAFLCEAACLNRFTGEMCDQVLGRTGSLSLLRHMHREELLLLPLDQRDEWFRMHPLLARSLSSELHESEPDRWLEIHRSAARWWTEQGDIDLAFEHAITAQDLNLAEELAAEHGPDYTSRNLYTTVHRWLASFPADYVRSSGALCSVHALDALRLGDGARAWHWYEQLERVLGAQPAPSASLRLRADALRITLSTEPASELLAAGERVIAENESNAWGSLALYALGGLQFLAGDPKAEETLTTGAFVAELNEMPVRRANCLAAAAIVADFRGDRELSATRTREAWDILNGYHAELPLTTALAQGILAVTEARAGRRDLAVAHLDRGRRMLVTFHPVAPWFNVLGRLALGRAALLVDDRTTSRSLLRELEHFLRAEPPDGGARPHLESLRASIDAARQLPSDRAWALTEAELKVLQFLPTNLTLGDIATRLFVSRNTVKTHVAAIYRKLDATSRSEAVDLARRTGVLEDAEPRD